MSFDNHFPEEDTMPSAISSARSYAEDAISKGQQCLLDRPGPAILVAFGLGLVAGVALATALRTPPPRKSGLAGSIEDSRERLAELFGSVASNLRDPLKKTYTSVSDRAASLGGSVVDAFIDKVRADRKLWRW